MGTTEKPIAIGDTVEFTPAEWRKIGDLAGVKQVISVGMENGVPIYFIRCGDICLKATKFEVKKHNP